jgi:hypothetical protein
MWYIKSTRSKRLSDTVDFKHNHIPNPTVTQADEIMTAIQEVIQTIKGLGRVQHSQETCKLKQLVNGASNILLNAHNTPSAPRMMPNNKHNPTATGKATRMHTQAKIVEQPPPRVANQHNRSQNTPTEQNTPPDLITSTLPPAMCTCSKTRETEVAVRTMNIC